VSLGLALAMLESSPFDKVLDLDVGVSGCGWECEDDGQKGILEQNSLPDFKTLVLLKWSGMRSDDGWVTVETHGVGLADEDAGKGSAIAGVVIVHEEVCDETVA